MTARHPHGALLAVLLAVGACSPAQEAPRVVLPVVVDVAGMAPFTTDKGYTITLTEARVALKDVVFTIAGEAHVASSWELPRLGDWLIPPAQAHPGHYQGGEVTGELVGSFVVDWAREGGRVLGDATLLGGRYTAANLTFDRGALGPLPAGDALIGHTALLAGTATRDGQQIRFSILLDAPEGRVLVGAPFEATLSADTAGTLGLRFTPRDELEGDTLLDGVDFQALDADADHTVHIAPDLPAVEDAYNTARRAFMTHDHYAVHLRP